MNGKTFWLLLLVATVILGCEKPQPSNQPVAPQKTALLSPEGNNTSGTSRTPDTPAYHWPADFKLPLEINMEAPDVPEEIRGPSPPIEEETKQP